MAAAVRTILADESQWVAWKKEVGGTDNRVCGSFARQPYAPPEKLESRVTLPGGACLESHHSSSQLLSCLDTSIVLL